MRFPAFIIGATWLIERRPVSSDREVPQRAAPTARLVNFAGKVTHSRDSSDAAVIGHSKIFIKQPSHACFHVPRMNIYEL